jgi:hypothetical protein
MMHNNDIVMAVFYFFEYYVLKSEHINLNNNYHHEISREEDCQKSP